MDSRLNELDLTEEDAGGACATSTDVREFSLGVFLCPCWDVKFGASATCFGPTTPTRAGKLADASVDPTEARNARATATTAPALAPKGYRRLEDGVAQHVHAAVPPRSTGSKTPLVPCNRFLGRRGALRCSLVHRGSGGARRGMIERRYVFPGVIELNVRARPR